MKECSGKGRSLSSLEDSLRPSAAEYPARCNRFGLACTSDFYYFCTVIPPSDIGSCAGSVFEAIATGTDHSRKASIIGLSEKRKRRKPQQQHSSERYIPAERQVIYIKTINSEIKYKLHETIVEARHADISAAGSVGQRRRYARGVQHADGGMDGNGQQRTADCSSPSGSRAST